MRRLKSCHTASTRARRPKPHPTRALLTTTWRVALAVLALNNPAVAAQAAPTAPAESTAPSPPVADTAPPPPVADTTAPAPPPASAPLDDERPQPARPPPPPDELLKPHTFVHFSPLTVGVTPIADASVFAYAWGIGVGRFLTAGKRFAATVGGFAEHMVIAASGYDSATVYAQSSLRLGPELRLGTRSKRIFAYGVGRLGVDLNFNYDEYNYDPNTGDTLPGKHYPVYPWVIGSLGGGVQGFIGRHFIIGGEPTVELGGEAYFLVRLRLILGVRF